ncbi:type IV pilus modification PilV family protein [Planococcus salinus]|uniref:Type II secretion system protein n=1 Tax=Planococcus salinus TaxID=1848460 RepID=A0A3M8PB27_9BACL|nr:type II secretion system protein [Planococcus salinus]RNF40885.1 type II secretion system protein [Planococcus salinus]
MGERIRYCLRKEKGMTLVEVLASVVLISLILMTFLMMFAQSARTNIASENIIDSTYIAQTEMERLYSVSKKPLSSSRKKVISDLGYMESESNSDWLKFEKDSQNESEEIIVRLENKSGEKMTRVIIEVVDVSRGISLAKMENVLIWEVTP